MKVFNFLSPQDAYHMYILFMIASIISALLAYIIYPRQTLTPTLKLNQWAQKTLKTQAMQSEVGLQLRFTCLFPRSFSPRAVRAG